MPPDPVMALDPGMAIDPATPSDPASVSGHEETLLLHTKFLTRPYSLKLFRPE